MKDKILIGLLFVFFATLFSCGGERKEVDLVFVFDKPLSSSVTRYPDYFKSIAMPFEEECEDGLVCFLPKPIKIARIDIDKKEEETNAWFFKDVGENTVDFSKSWLEVYFNDSLPPAYLFRPLSLEVDTDNFLKKNKSNTFIYSESLDAGEYMGVKIYNEATSVSKEFQKLACQSGLEKIYVLINPTLNISNDTSNVNPNSIVGDIINVIANRKGAQKDRLEKVESIFDEHFEVGSKVIEVTKEGKPINGNSKGFPLVETWLKELAFSRTIESVEIIEKKRSASGKLTEISIREIHRGE